MTTATAEMTRQRVNQVIRASAGTGKTFHLSNRFLGLLFDDVPLDQILATTFTRQAAGEILDRILYRVAIAAEDECELGRLCDALERRHITREACRDKLKQLTANLHRINVSTLDAFFVQLAGAYSLEIGLPVGWRILEAADEDRLRDLAINQMLEQGRLKDSVELMYLLTRGEARRSVSQLIRDTVSGLHHLYADSDVAAWNQLECPPAHDADVVSNAVRELGELEGGTQQMQAAKAKDYERAVQEQWLQFLENGIAAKVAAGNNTYFRQPVPEPWLEVYSILVSHAGSVYRNRIAVQTATTHRLLGRFDEFLQRAKFEAKCFRFDDIVRRLCRPHESSDVDRYAFRLDWRIEHLLLDEFQDTSLNQWQVIRPFARRIAEDPVRRSFFCVGDVKQAIYGWRGGDADILDLLHEELDGLRMDELSASYRSAPEIIAFVNELNKGLRKHDKLTDESACAVRRWCEQYPDHRTVRKELAGFVTIETTSEAEENNDEQSDGEGSADPVLRDTAAFVRQLRNQTPAARIAVLARTNFAVAKLIFHLRQLGVSATEVGGNPLADSTAVQLIMSLLKLADHPTDQCAAYHLAMSPWAGDLKLGGTLDKWAAFQLSARTRKQLAVLGYGRAIQMWADQLRLSCDAREWKRLSQLVELAYRHQQRIERPITVGYSSQQRVSMRTGEFLQTIRTERVADPSESQIQVMTVHQAKGLQFDVVVLTELDGRLKSQSPQCVWRRPTPFDRIDMVTTYISASLRRFFPDAVKAMHGDFEQDDVREQLCILYVACTRAIHALHMILKPAKSALASTAGLIQSALELRGPLEPGKRVYQMGDERWFEKVDWREQQDQGEPVDDRTTRPQTIRLRSSGGSPRRTAETLSPSSREGGARIRLADRLALEGTESLRYGTVIHAWLAQIKWLESAGVDGEALRRIARQEGMKGEQTDRAIASFQAMLQRPEIQRLLKESEYRQSERFARFGFGGDSIRIDVRNEQPITGRTSEGLVSGIADRLLVFRNTSNQPVAADIIDYKTDAIGEKPSLNAKFEFYRPQILAYRAAIQQMLQLDASHVQACLVFVGQGIVRAVE
jgi:ATP-dependent exoDNAse (exonuclease V) beta subunit